MSLSSEVICNPPPSPETASSAAEIHRLRSELAALVGDLAHEKQERDKARAVTTALLSFIAGNDTDLSLANRALRDNLNRANAECVKLRARLLHEKAKRIELNLHLNSLTRATPARSTRASEEDAFTNHHNSSVLSDIHDSSNIKDEWVSFNDRGINSKLSQQEPESTVNGTTDLLSPLPQTQFVHRFSASSEPVARQACVSVVEVHGQGTRSAFNIIKQRDVILNESELLPQKQANPRGGRRASKGPQSARKMRKHSGNASLASFESSAKSSVQQSKSSKRSAAKTSSCSSNNKQAAILWQTCPPLEWFNRDLGCLFEPPPGTPESHRVVIIGNIAPGARLDEVLDIVRGGQVLSSELHNTLNITNAQTASIEFFSQASAARYASFATRHPIWLRNRRVSVTHLLTATCPMPLRVLLSVEKHRHTRCLTVRSRSKFMSLGALKNQLCRGESIDSHGLLTVKKENGGARLLSFKSVDAAGWAYAKIQGFVTFLDYNAAWTADPCEQPVHTILGACRPPTPVQSATSLTTTPLDDEEDLISFCSMSGEEALEHAAITPQSVAEYESPTYAPKVNLGRRKVDYSDLEY